MQFRNLAVLPALTVTLLVWASPSYATSCDTLSPYGTPAAGAEEGTVVVCEADQSEAYFVTDYDRARVAPRWVEYVLTHDQIVRGANSGITRAHDGIPFAADPALDGGGFTSPTDKDFTGIADKGYDRGHLLDADAMKWSLDAYHSTFVVSNFALQASYFNEHLWQKVEIQERGWACDLGKIYAVTGVNFAPNAKTFHSTHRPGLVVTVPSEYWKAVYTPADGGHFIGIIFKNNRNAGPLDGRAVHSLLDMESLTALKLFPGLPDDQRQKLDAAQPDLTFWRLDYKSTYECQ